MTLQVPRRHLPLVSAPVEEEEEDLDQSPLELFTMPEPVRAKAYAPIDLGASAPRVSGLMNAVLEALRSEVADSVVPVEDRSPVVLALVDEVLGEGEVHIEVAGASVYRIQESQLAGVWRVRTFDKDGHLVGDHVEVADVPRVVRAAAERATLKDVPVPDESEGLMNARPLLAELAHRSASFEDGAPNHVVSLTLLPMTNDDMRAVQDALGTGPVQGISRGYGTCHVALTTRARIWSVQYTNAMGAVILDTLEVGDVPVALRATREDMIDSAERLQELLEAYA